MLFKQNNSHLLYILLVRTLPFLPFLLPPPTNTFPPPSCPLAGKVEKVIPPSACIYSTLSTRLKEQTGTKSIKNIHMGFVYGIDRLGARLFLSRAYVSTIYAHRGRNPFSTLFIHLLELNPLLLVPGQT